jgi:hypothetical protein
MRNEHPLEWVRVGSLAGLDALVGRYITGEEPLIHWEDSHAHMRFESVEEGLEALREPYIQQFIPASVRAETVLLEVQEFEPYASDLASAWRVVEKVATPRAPLRLWQDRDVWCAAFGEFPPVEARTAPVTICLAALRVRGLEVDITADAVHSLEP